MIFQTGSIQENTMKYKFAAADMDGTLLNDSDEITPHTVKIIRQAVDKGLIFSICTGRPIQGVSRYQKQLGIQGPVIMSYAIKNKTFLHITQTRDYSFYDLSGNRQFSVHNANAFLDMTPDAISGKTGFTGNAGYCYVGACKNEGRTFIIALLGCGWPNNKSYKWKDTMKLLEYGKENFHKEVYWQEPAIPEIQVKDGVSENSTVSDESPAQSEQNLSAGLGKAAFIKGVIQAEDSDKKKEVLLKDSEKVTCNVRLQKSLAAPVKKGQKIGQVTFSIGELVLDDYFVTADRNIVKITYLWCVNKVFHDFFH